MLDHIVIYVSDLTQAKRTFTNLGFTVTSGGSHERTENALICFSDQTYIELLALKSNWQRPLIRFLGHLNILDRTAKKKADMHWRLLPWITGNSGFVDWCVRPGDLKGMLLEWQNAGVDIITPETFERLRPDGEKVIWYLGAPKDFELPFLIEDVTPVDLRIPTGDATRHANEVTGVSEIILSVSDITRVKSIYESVDLIDTDSKLGGVKITFDHKAGKPGPIGLKLFYSGHQTRQLEIENFTNTNIWLVPKNHF